MCCTNMCAQAPQKLLFTKTFFPVEEVDHAGDHAFISLYDFQQTQAHCTAKTTFVVQAVLN